MKVRVGLGSCGIAAGALEVWDELDKLQQAAGFSIEKQQTGCSGMCYQEPLIDIIEDGGSVYSYGKVNARRLQEIVKAHQDGTGPLEEYLTTVQDKGEDFLSRQVRVALRNCGHIDPESLADYRLAGGYKALEKAILMTPEEVIDEIKASGLRGRGGAGFPTWFKWQDTRKQPGETKYVVCNADEGDPGAFMDRSVLEGDPHAVLEGMTIAGYAIGAKEGIIYCRAEYPLAIKRLSIAIETARDAGLLGEHILNSEFSFDIRIKQGAGAFVCGEETALIASLEGERGMPRLKPPYPSVYGFWGKPTNINNVETFANVPWIMTRGGEAFAAMGTADSKGTKVFALAGNVVNTGLVEVPMGTTLREVIFELGGGIPNGRKFKAAQIGGPSGACLTEEHFDLPLEYDALTKAGAMMGSGGLIVMDDTKCMVDVARFFLDFTCDESCGKCPPCRIGTKRMLEILERITNGEGREEDIDNLYELASIIKASALCGLGQTSPNPVLSTIKHFRNEYLAHIRDKQCPAGVCRSLMNYVIIPEMCKGCGICAKHCPSNAISGEIKKPYVIDPAECIRCGACMEKCPFKAIRRG